MESMRHNTFAERLDALCLAREVSTPQVAQAIAISPQYLSRLRYGHADNPSYDIIKKLAQFFRVDPNYFFDMEGTNLTPKATALALRASQLDDDAQDALLGMTEYIERLKHKQDPSPPPED